MAKTKYCVVQYDRRFVIIEKEQISLCEPIGDAYLLTIGKTKLFCEELLLAKNYKEAEQIRDKLNQKCCLCPDKL